MLLIDQTGKLHLAYENRAPKRNGRRAALRVVPAGGVDWRAVRKAADDFRKRTERYAEARRVG